MATHRMDPEPDDGEFIEVPTDGHDRSRDLGLGEQQGSPLGPIIGASLGRGWYSKGAAKRGRNISGRAVMLTAAAAAAVAIIWRLAG